MIRLKLPFHLQKAIAFEDAMAFFYLSACIPLQLQCKPALLNSRSAVGLFI